MRYELCVGKRLGGGVDGWEMKCLLRFCACASGDSASAPAQDRSAAARAPMSRDLLLAAPPGPHKLSRVPCGWGADGRPSRWDPAAGWAGAADGVQGEKPLRLLSPS